MSRDWTPKEFREAIKITGHSNIEYIDTLVWVEGKGENKKTIPMYTKEEKALAHKYKNLGEFGSDLLMKCKSFTATDIGKQLLQDMNDYFDGKEIDKELGDNLQLWYEGQFCPGYYMDDNNEEFYIWLKTYYNKLNSIEDEDPCESCSAYGSEECALSPCDKVKRMSGWK